MRDRPDLAPLFWLALFGFGVKAGFFPAAHLAALGARQRPEPCLRHHVRAWPSRWASMGSSASAAGCRCRPPPAGWCGRRARLSALLGIAFAFAQNDLKRLLAYCSVENIGIILIGLGVAMLGRGARRCALGPAGAGRGAAACLESRLVQIAVVLWRRFGAARHRHAGNEPAGRLVAAMPWTAGLVRARRDRDLRAAAAQRICQRMAGLSRPVRRGHEPEDPSAWIAMPAAICWRWPGPWRWRVSLKAGAVIFLGAPRTQAAEARPRMRPADARADAGAGRRLRGHRAGPVSVWPVLARAVDAWSPAWAAEPPAPLVTLGWRKFASLAALLVGGDRLWLRADGDRNAPRPSPGTAVTPARPRGCNTPAALSRASPPAGSPGCFSPSAPSAGRGASFRREASRLERIPETVLERILEPAGRAVLRLRAPRAAAAWPAAILYPLCRRRTGGVGTPWPGRGDEMNSILELALAAGLLAAARPAAAGHHQQGEGLGGRPPRAAGAAALLRSREAVAQRRGDEHPRLAGLYRRPGGGVGGAGRRGAAAAARPGRRRR